MTAPVSVVAPEEWTAEIDAVIQLITGRFARPETVANAVDMIMGLVANLERKNCWTIAEHAGHANPDRLQHLLARAVWDTDGVRDDLAAYVVDRLINPGEQAIMVIDETGDLKKGTETVGVQRQYTGTAGRIENAQVAVFATLVTEQGHTFIDRALYVPRCWIDDPDRRTQAGVPTNVTFATKPALAAAMIGRAVTADVPLGWVTGDEVYGSCPALRATIRSHNTGYVLAVASTHRATAIGAEEPDTAIDLGLSTHNWERLSAGPGAKGQRYYSWARCEIEPENNDTTGGHHWMLFRRNDTTGEWAYYRCWHPEHVPLAELVRVAGQRWRIEENFQSAKGHVGLDQHQVRRWDSWHRWTTLAMIAHALLTVTAANARHTDNSTGLIPITVAETRRLLHAAWHHIQSMIDALAWSHWRRRHQHRARQSHYRTRGQPPPPE